MTPRSGAVLLLGADRSVRVARPRFRRRQIRRRAVLAVQYLLLGVVLLLADGPLLWIAVTALRPPLEVMAYPPTIVPSALTLESFQKLFTSSPFETYLANSALVSSSATLITVVMGTIGAYAFARFEQRFLFLRVLGWLSLLAYMLPSILLVVPIAVIVSWFGLANSLAALVLIYSATLLPFALWILRSYFSGVAVHLEEAAMIDGATRFGAFYRVVVPLAVSGVISVAVFIFNAAWGEYLFASILISDPSRLTLSLGLTNLLVQGEVFSWGELMAGAVVTTVPVVVLFAIAQRQLVTGLGEGAVRG
jgi:multiple sugar transport system permease protein